ncbi:MAG: flagellar biosynthetic protein FliR [candidate division Zixibacteria bacterium]|nr:flagellar biosynthetic protein FliR [candidate division Zixibacteria bacterium]
MFDFINYGTETLQIFMLVLLRTSGLFIIAPIFSNKSVPKMVRVGLVIILAGILVSAIKQPYIPEIVSLWQLAGLAIKEILVGFVIGLTFRFLFMGIKTGGAILGYQLGLAMVSLPDVDTSGQVAVIARLWVLLATLIFLAVNGHHIVITSLVDSYRAMPVGQVATDVPIGEMILRYSSYVFVIAIKVAAPISVTLFLVDVSLGTIAKMMPTMNVFFVGFPIKIGVGLTVVAMSLPLFSYLLRNFIRVLDGNLQVMYAAWGKV